MLKINQTAILIVISLIAILLSHGEVQAQTPNVEADVRIIRVVALNDDEPARILKPPEVDFAVVWEKLSSSPIEEQIVTLEVGLSDGSTATGSVTVDGSQRTVNIRLRKRADFRTYKAKVTVKFRSSSTISTSREFRLGNFSANSGAPSSAPRARTPSSAPSTGSASRSPTGGVPLALRITSATLRGSGCGGGTDCLDVKWERIHPETTRLDNFELQAEITFVKTFNVAGESVQRTEETRAGGAGFPAGPENQKALAFSPPPKSTASLIKVTLRAEFSGFFIQNFDKQGTF